jgi:hypothetical protein
MDAPGFSDVQRTEMSNIMAQAMKIFNQTQAARRIFQPEDVGYFSHGPQANDENVYYNIFSFTDRLRFKANSIDADVIRQNINACLLGTAKDWYDNKLDRLSRSGLRHAPNGIIKWCKLLEERFHDSSRSLLPTPIEPRPQLFDLNEFIRTLNVSNENPFPQSFTLPLFNNDICHPTT